MTDIVAYFKEVKFLRKAPKTKISAQKYMRRFRTMFGDPQTMEELSAAHDVKWAVWIAKKEAERIIESGEQTLEELIVSMAEDRPVTLKDVHEEAPHYAPTTLRQTLSIMSQEGMIDRCARGVYVAKGAPKMPARTVKNFILEMPPGKEFTATEIAVHGFTYSQVQGALFRMYWAKEIERVRHGVYRRAAE